MEHPAEEFNREANEAAGEFTPEKVAFTKGLVAAMEQRMSAGATKEEAIQATFEANKEQMADVLGPGIATGFLYLITCDGDELAEAITRGPGKNGTIEREREIVEDKQIGNFTGDDVAREYKYFEALEERARRCKEGFQRLMALLPAPHAVLHEHVSEQEFKEISDEAGWEDEDSLVRAPHR